MSTNLENLAVTPGLEMVSFYFNFKERQCSGYCTMVLISHVSKVMLKILQARLQQYMNQELPDVQTGFRNGRGIRDQIANIHWLIEKPREFQKKSTSASLTMLKHLIVWITTNWKILKRDGNTKPPYLPPEKAVCKSTSNS